MRRNAAPVSWPPATCCTAEGTSTLIAADQALPAPSLHFPYRNQSDNYIRTDFTGFGLVTNDALKTLLFPSERLRGILG
jgi:hypothetical protein